MIPDQRVKIRISNNNKDYYDGKGYHFEKGEMIEVNVNDLSDGSGVLVRYICDFCKGENQITERDKYKGYRFIINSRSFIDKDCCNHKDCKIAKRLESSKYNKKAKKEKVSAIITKSFSERYPHLVTEWNFQKNHKSINDVIVQRERIWWVCNKGHEWEATLSNRVSIRKAGCPYCSNYKVNDENSLVRTFPLIAKDWHPVKNGELTPYDVTSGSAKRVWWMCEDGHEWKAQVKSRTVTGSSCPSCKSSKGEKKIESFLRNLGLSYKIQYKFKDLLGDSEIKPLKFDFAIFNKRGELIMLIEYDGAFHFKKVYDGDGYEQTIEYDKRKNEYCQTKGIPLLRIPYWELKNVEEIIIKKILDVLT